MLNRVDKSSPVQCFERALAELSEGQALLLQVIHDLRLVPREQLFCVFHLRKFRGFSLSLAFLELRGLVTQVSEVWAPTWFGDGVANWRQQKRIGKSQGLDQVPEPRCGENGYLLGPPCREYRNTLFAPGYCWCCRWRADHVSEYLSAAEDLLG